MSQREERLKMTAKRIIEGALRTIGVLASGEEAQPSEIQDGLEALNGLLSTWNNVSLLIPSITTRTFDLKDSKTYTYGIGGDFDAPRPIAIQFAQFQDIYSYFYTCEIYNNQTWAMNDRPVQIRPLGCYFEPSYPLAVVHFPTAPYTTDKFRVQVLEPLTYISSPLDSFTLPDGYERALRLNLAIELASEFGTQPGPMTVQLAQEAKHTLEIKNTKVELMTFDFQSTSTTIYNIIQGPVK